MQKDQHTVENNVLLLLQNKTADYGEKIACGIQTQQGWNEFTYKGLGLLSRKVGSYLINQLHVTKDDKIAVLSESRPEFGAVVYGTALAGATFVPLDIKLTKYELRSILSNCEPRILFVSGHYMQLAKELQAELGFIEKIVVLENLHGNDDMATVYNIPDNYNAKWVRPSLGRTAFLIYTSGTTGAPKGVEISYLNILTQLKAFVKVLPDIFPNFNRKKDSMNMLSILPMNHLFELTVGFSTFMHWGFSIYYASSLRPKDILSTMREKNIHFMITVPAFLKLLKSSIENQIASAPKAKQNVFKFLLFIAKFIPSLKLRKLLFKPIHEKFGGSFWGAISGGAPLDPAVGQFFERIGIKIYQGYGLTETSPVVCVDTRKRTNHASIGKAFDCYDVKIDPQTGELMLRGKSVMKGYYKQPELTAEVIDKDGWLHTGDVARMDKDGYLYITGRIKNMIVLSGGKKVFPEEVEAVLEQSDKFTELCVFGTSKTTGSKEGCEEIAVVIVPSEKVQGTDEEIEKIVREEVKVLSMQLASYKRPMNIIISKEPLPRTTTRKVKRNVVKELVGAC